MSAPLDHLPSSRVPSVWPSRFQAVDFDYWLDEISTSAANSAWFRGQRFLGWLSKGGDPNSLEKTLCFLAYYLFVGRCVFATWNSSNHLEDMLELKGVVATCKLFPTGKKDHEKNKNIKSYKWIRTPFDGLVDPKYVDHIPGRSTQPRQRLSTPEKSAWGVFSGGGV